MTQEADWIAEPPRRGGFSAVAARTHERPVIAALAVAATGALAFMASLALKWQTSEIGSINFGRDSDVIDAVDGPMTYSSGAAAPELLGFVYAMGMLALLTLAGLAINRSELATRVRFGAAGLAVGVLSLVVSITVSLRDVYNQSGLTSIASARQVTMSYEPGVFCAYAAAILPAVAIWLVARPALREARAAHRERSDAEDPTSDDGAADGFPAGLVMRQSTSGPGTSGWAAADAEELDLTVTPDR